MAFGKCIRELREDKGLFLREVGATLKLDNAFISKAENKDRLLPRKHLERLAAFLNVSLDKLLILWMTNKIKTIIEDNKIGREVIKKFLEN